MDILRLKLVLGPVELRLRDLSLLSSSSCFVWNDFFIFCQRIPQFCELFCLPFVLDALFGDKLAHDLRTVSVSLHEASTTKVMKASIFEIRFLSSNSPVMYK